MWNLKRRALLKGMGSIAITSALPNLVHAGVNRKPKIGIAGGGILGASIALHLARRGAEVILFEKVAPASGATSKSFAWINGFSDDVHYRRLRNMSILAYHELDQTLNGDLEITWGGYLSWRQDAEQTASLKQMVLSHEQSGVVMRIIDDAEFANIAPTITPGDYALAAYSSNDGHVDPVHVTHVLLKYAVKHGAVIKSPCKITGLDLKGNKLHSVRTCNGQFALDSLVIAAGVDTPGIAAMANIDVPLKPSAGILAHSKSFPHMFKPILDGPEVYFKQKRDGRLVGSDAAKAPNSEAHKILEQLPKEFPSKEIEEMHGTRILNKIAGLLPAAKGGQLERVTLGWRPLPIDDFPIVGYTEAVPNIYLCVTHSGVTLAPILGRSIASELLGDARIEILKPYRLDRFVS